MEIEEADPLKEKQKSKGPPPLTGAPRNPPKGEGVHLHHAVTVGFREALLIRKYMEELK